MELSEWMQLPRCVPRCEPQEPIHNPARKVSDKEDKTDKTDNKGAHNFGVCCIHSLSARRYIVRPYRRCRSTNRVQAEIKPSRCGARIPDMVAFSHLSQPEPRLYHWPTAGAWALSCFASAGAQRSRSRQGGGSGGW